MLLLQNEKKIHKGTSIDTHICGVTLNSRSNMASIPKFRLRRRKLNSLKDSSMKPRSLDEKNT